MTPSEVYALARDHGRLSIEAAVIATAVSWPESGLNPDAVGDENLEDAKWGPSVGLWQIRSLRAEFGTGGARDAQRLKDPKFNAHSMGVISKGGTDFTPWTDFRNGKYKQYLDRVRAAIKLPPINPTKEAPMPSSHGWMPDVIHTPPRNRSGLSWLDDDMPWKFVGHTTESNYRRNSGGRENYHGHQSYPHFEISEDAIEQYLPLTVGAYALAAGTASWGYGNSAHAVQAEVVWNSVNSPNMSPALLRNIARVLTFVREFTGMKPNLPPQGFPTRVSRSFWFDREAWYEYEGLCGHGNVPGNDDRWDWGQAPGAQIIAISDSLMGVAPQRPDTKEDQLFSPSDIATVHIVAMHSQLLLTSTGDTHGSQVVQHPANGSLNQRWKLVGHEDGTISLVNRAGDLALDRPDYVTEAGTVLQVGRTEYNGAQRWVDEQHGKVRRIWTPGTNRCLDVASNSQNWGDQAVLWYGKPEDFDNQFFMFVPTV